MTDPLRIAVIVNPDLPPGLAANTVAAIGIGLGARIPALAADRLADARGRDVATSSKLPVPILAADADTIRAVLLKALDRGEALAVVPFPAFARGLHDFADYAACFPGRDLAAEAIDGLGLAGPDKAIRSLTGALRLLR